MGSRQQPGNRYRGRRRLPKLPSRRYAAVVTTAFLGAGVVASGRRHDPREAGASGGSAIRPRSHQHRGPASTRLTRRNVGGPHARPCSVDQGAPDVWLLPLPTQFQITTLFEVRWGTMHWGVDMASVRHPYYAAHAGTVMRRRLEGGYGNAIRIDHGKGVETVYGHSSKLLVARKANTLTPARCSAWSAPPGSRPATTSTSRSTSTAEHKDPMKYLLDHGVDIAKRLEAANGGTVIS